MSDDPKAPVVDIRSKRKNKSLREIVGGSPPGDDWWPPGTPREPDESVAWEDIARVKGKIVATPANIGLIVARSEEWDLCFDEFADRAIVRKVPDVGAAKPRMGELDEYHVACAINWLTINYGLEAGKKSAMDGLVFAAKQKWFDPVKDYMRSLEWDGVSRIETWLRDYVGVCDESSLFLGRLWLISAVARALSPGCKADYMLVLIGKQGAKKTSVLETICPKPEWFQPDLPNLKDKDSMHSLTGALIVNADEMNAFKRADVAELSKNFLTRSYDRYRPPYGAFFKMAARRCVFAGTSNYKEVLNDPTGGRRFWCVEVGKIDLAGLKRDRDQLWAEAVAMYTDGAQWWPEASREQAISEKNKDQFTTMDPWAATIESACSGNEESGVTLRDLFMALGFEGESKYGTGETRRITGMLIAMGWEQRGEKRIGKKRERTWKKK